MHLARAMALTLVAAMGSACARSTTAAVGTGLPLPAVARRATVEVAVRGEACRRGSQHFNGITVARALFAEQPDSVLRLNALGYALIQRPEGLEEGYRLLWRGFNYGQLDYAVVDSLGWAYYLYGHFDQARALIERARDLTASDPNFEVLDHLGDIYWRLNRRDDARAAWRQALDARPDAIRRRDIERKLQRGLTTPAPRRPRCSLLWTRKGATSAA